MGMHDRDWYKNRSSGGNISPNGRNSSINYGSGSPYVPRKKKREINIPQQVILPIAVLMLLGTAIFIYLTAKL